MYLQINSPNVVREFFDGEIVVVNLESGSYYSFEKLAATVWLLLEKGIAVEEVKKLLSKHYEIDFTILDQAIETFIQQMLAEKLVRLEEACAIVADQEAVAGILAAAESSFVAPSLRKYNDMQDLLLLDPIHDVDDAGWPATKQVNQN